MSGGQSQNLVAYDAWGGFSGKVDIEMDVLFATDAWGRKHWGLYLSGGASGSNGYRFSTMDGGGWSVALWAGGSQTGLGAFSSSGVPGPTIAVGNTYTICVERDATGTFSMSIDGVKLPNTVNNTAYETIRPGFFVYGCGIRINELRVYQYEAEL